jgi:tetratricopeptide (TPR) repeat protein
VRTGLRFEVASLTERSGNCEAALTQFEKFTQESTDQDSVTAARWRMGTCGLERGRQLRAAGELEKALDLLQITLDLGAPQNLLDQAWFERGEALDALGRGQEAIDAFQRVVDLGGTSRTALAGRAERRIQEIRVRPVP